jgi:hypothetical protein
MTTENPLSRAALVLASILSALLAGSPAAAEDEAAPGAADVIELEGATIGRLGDSSAATDVEFSDAERLLWVTEQLSNVTSPSRLEYAFTRSGSMGDGFEDSIQLEITRIKDDGMRSARVTFLTGERNQYVPPNENTNGNPLLGIYLQGDVYEMNRMTDGHWRYFHRRIKTAFAEAAEVSDVEVDYQGATVAAKRIRISPYADDPKRELFEEYADKTYEFIVSDEIPGYLYSVRTVIPGAEGDFSSPLVEEKLTLLDVSPLQ